MSKQDFPTTIVESMPSRRTVLGAGGAVGLTLLSPGSIFAQGAVRAAEWVVSSGRKGSLTFDDFFEGRGA